jgi:hypothetical protein
MKLQRLEPASEMQHLIINVVRLNNPKRAFNEGTIRSLKWLNENMAAVTGHWTPYSRGPNIRCSPVGHAPYAYSYGITRRWWQPTARSRNKNSVM